ncbi:hypothetical protein M3Y99_00903800 [Aphelenchoides fujianensis]|nr:hypothetical protein M3Y99_00903800 [Aphelenchoides fujianensis]
MNGTGMIGLIFMDAMLFYATAFVLFVFLNYSKPKSKQQLACALVHAYGFVVCWIVAVGCLMRSTLLLEIGWYGWVLGFVFWSAIFIGLSLGMFGTSQGQSSDFFTPLFKNGNVLPAIGGYFVSMTHCARLANEAHGLLLGT